MLNDRLAEAKQQAVPPFQSATARVSNFFLSRTKEAFSLAVSCKEDNILGGLIAAVGVTERARQHGFTQSELQRAKGQQLNHDEPSIASVTTVVMPSMSVPVSIISSATSRLSPWTTSWS